MTPRDTAQRDRLRARIRRSHPACYICGLPIDYTLRTPDPGSFEIDHVVPLKLGGTDDITNVRAAHRSCNSAKRARLIPPIIRRSKSLA